MDCANPSDTAQAIEHDLPCIRCGYNLRTLARDRRCPECGLSAELTLSLGGDLAKSRPSYLTRISRACGLLLLARLVPFAAAMLACALVNETAWMASIPLMGCAYGLGVLLLGAREHPRLPPELPWTSWLLKGGGIIILLATLITLPAFAIELARRVGADWALRLGMSTTLPFVPRESILVTTLIAGWCAYAVSPILETRMMVRIAKRLADAWLGEHALIAGIGATASNVAMTLLVLLRVLQDVSAGQNLGFVLLLLSLTALLLFWLWMAACSWIATKGFRRAAALARQRWQANDEPAGS